VEYPFKLHVKAEKLLSKLLIKSLDTNNTHFRAYFIVLWNNKIILTPFILLLKCSYLGVDSKHYFGQEKRV